MKHLTCMEKKLEKPKWEQLKSRDFQVTLKKLLFVLFPSDKYVATSGHAIHYQWQYPKQHIQHS